MGPMGIAYRLCAERFEEFYNAVQITISDLISLCQGIGSQPI